MAKTSFLKYCQLAWLSGPVCDRLVYRRMVQSQPRNILEIGLGLGVRSLRLFQVARRYCAASEIYYTGIDLFEGRGPGHANLPLKDAYKLLRSQGVHVRLVPGEPAVGLQLTSQLLTNIDLIVIDSAIGDSDLMPAWKWMKRIMHGETVVMRQLSPKTGNRCESWGLADVERFAGGARPPARAA